MSRYLIYNDVVSEAIKRGIITYTTSGGLLNNYTVNTTALRNLEEEMGIDQELIKLLFGS